MPAAVLSSVSTSFLKRETPLLSRLDFIFRVVFYYVSSWALFSVCVITLFIRLSRVSYFLNKALRTHRLVDSCVIAVLSAFETRFKMSKGLYKSAAGATKFRIMKRNLAAYVGREKMWISPLLES